jgi:ABC-2 type transport system ATP-binding protein
MEEADRLADRIALIDHGRVIAEGTPADLKAGLGGTVIDITLADPAAAVRATAPLADRLGLSPRVDGSSVELTVDDGARALVDVLRTLDTAGLSPTGLAVREPSLDDVFLTLTGQHLEGEAA